MTPKEIIDQIKIAEKQLFLADKDNFTKAHNEIIKTFRLVNPEPHLVDLWKTMVVEFITLLHDYRDNNFDKHSKVQLFVWLGHMKMFIDSSHTN